MSFEVDICNPVYARVRGQEVREATLPYLAEGQQVRIGFLSNQKPNTDELLRLVEQGLRKHFQVEARHFVKADASHPAPLEVIREISQYADVAVLATAD